MSMEPSFSLHLTEQNRNLRGWADGNSVGWAQYALPVVVKLKDPPLFPHEKQYPLKPEFKGELSVEELMLLNYGVGEDSWESLGL